jgi:hypothetical protein
LRSAEEITMFAFEPFARFESQSVARVSVPDGLPALAAVLAVGLVVFVLLLAATTGISQICPAPRAGTPIHLGR